jgi:hypothetical protein
MMPINKLRDIHFLSDFYVIDYPWKDEDIELLKSAYRARGFELPKDPSLTG